MSHPRFGYHYQRYYHQRGKRHPLRHPDVNPQRLKSHDGDNFVSKNQTSNKEVTLQALTQLPSSPNSPDKNMVQTAQQAHSESVATSAINLLSLPHELLVLILSNLDLGTATFVSTTCLPLHSAYKTLNPHTKVPLSTPCYTSSGLFHAYLGDMLVSWMSSRYRRKHWSRDPVDPSWAPPQFLNRDVYGEKEGRYGDEIWQRENALFWRYLDFHRFERRGEGKRREKILPRPFNKGEEWYAEARSTVIKDSETRRGGYEWMAFWDDAEVFRGIGFGEKLKVLQTMEKNEKAGEMALGLDGLACWIRRQWQLLLWWRFILPVKSLRPCKREAAGNGRNRMWLKFAKG